MTRSAAAAARTGRKSVFLELGVFNASSINFIARNLRDAASDASDIPIIYGFDSFQGLPEDWHKIRGPVGRSMDVFKAGAFKLENLPPVEDNVRLIKGWFNETVPSFVDALRKSSEAEGSLLPQARFVHIDCDLFSSAREALRAVTPLVGPGTVMVFDEIVNFAGFNREGVGELRAFFAWLQEYPRKFEIIYSPWRLEVDDRELRDIGLGEYSLIQSVAIELLE